MRKILALSGIIAAAAMALVSCSVEIDDPNYVEPIVKESVPFEIVASTGVTKTTIDGYNISWEADDAINLFYAEEGETDTFIDNGEFTISDADLAENKFKGSLYEAPSTGNYDWYAIYPYVSQRHDPKSTAGYTIIGSASDGVQTQTGNSSTAHLAGPNYPLGGKAEAVAFDATPSLTMSSLASFVKVNVTNNSGADLTVTNVRFVAPEEIVGTFNIDITGEKPAYTKKTAVNTANLVVDAGEVIADGGSAQFYLGLKPFTISDGVIKVSVNGYERTYNITKEYKFEAGKVKTVNFNYDNTSDAVYEKVTAISEGQYLIVYEDGELAFNGGLETFDAVGNSVGVLIDGTTIYGSPVIDAAIVTIAAMDGGYSVKGASGKYVGQTSNANGLQSYETALANTISFDDDGNANLVSGGAYLRYNSTSGQTRFRYYKSSTYSSQKAIALYKKVGGSAPVQLQDATVTIDDTNIPTEPMEKDATFEFTASTTSDATEFTVTLSPDGAATVAPKTGAANTWVVTAGEPNSETQVTLTVSVAATATYKAASDSKTFTVKKKVNTEVLDFSSNVDYEAGTNSTLQKVTANGVEDVDILKMGTSSKNGSGTIYVPAGSTEITFFAVAWTGVNDASLTFTQDDAQLGDAIVPVANSGLSGNAQPYVMDDITSANAYTITLTSDNPITVNAVKRVGIFGVKGNGTGAINHPATQTQLAFASANVELPLGGSQTIKATVTPSNATVTYSSSAPTIVSVDENTGTITTGGAAYVGASATITANVAASPGEYTAASASYTVTVIAASTQPTTVSDIVALADKTAFTNAEGLVVAKCARGVIVTDGTKNVLLYNWSSGASSLSSLNIGDQITFEGTKKTYNGVPEVDPISNIVVVSSGNAVTYPAAKDITTTFDSYNASEAEYVSFQGTLTISGSYYNVTVDGATNVGSISYPLSNPLLVTGKNITVTGYYNGKSGSSTKYINIILVDVEENTAPSFGASLTNNNTVPATGGTKTITVTGNVDWTASANNGATLNPQSGNGAGSIEVTIPENTDTENGKTYTVTVSAAGFDNIVINIEQSNAAAPGADSFDLYSGEITEGDYIIYYNGKAMKNTVASNRLQYSEVTPNGDSIAEADADASIVWHIAKSGDYWTIYNADVAKYAASTGAKNQGALVTTVDDKALWTVTGDGTYEFVNKLNASKSVNANLRNNGTYGFATYSTSTGGALTLYKYTGN